MKIRTLKWTQDLCVGSDQLNDDHRKLISLTNKLITAYYAGVGDAVVIDIFREVLTRVTQHFREEEDLMRILAHPDLEEHHRDHQDFLEKLDLFSFSGQGGELLILLSGWLVEHISSRDRLYEGLARSHEQEHLAAV